ncbi:g8274 [Coccomyxa elongata]
MPDKFRETVGSKHLRRLSAHKKSTRHTVAARRSYQKISRSVQGLAEVTFYSKWRLGEVERCVLRLLAAAHRKLHGGTSDPYQVFPLQDPAFQWADNHPHAPDVRIFSSERGPEGKRCFIATTLEAFWKRYRDMLPQHRHCYEIIRHGYPCHLYFDLEYRKEFNADVDGDALVDGVLKLCAKGLKEKFQLDYKESWVLELDSSSPEKFSRHVILRIPSAAFQNNFHVGAFVKDICAGVEKDDPDNPAQQLMINKDGQGSRALFIDGGVYTRNRAFRLFLSSKAGKEWVLQPTERFQGARLSHRDIFFASLICNVPEGCRLLRCYEDEDGAAFSWVRHGRLIAPSRYSEAAMERCAQPQLGPSRHPDIERFITSVCNQGGVQGAVRSWVEWPEAGLLLLNMRHNRWCGNIGRAHRSNGIFYVVSLQEGVWYQKCYDPECRDYRSEMMPLPHEIVARLQAEQQVLEGCHPQSAGTAPAQQQLSHDGMAPCVTTAAGSARGANHAGVDALAASAAHACGGGMGVFEGVQEDEVSDLGIDAVPSNPSDFLESMERSQPTSAQPGMMPAFPPLDFFGGLLNTFGIGSSASPSPPPPSRSMTPATPSSVTSPTTIASSTDLAPLQTPVPPATPVPVPVATAAAKPAATPAPVTGAALVPVATPAAVATPAVPAVTAAPVIPATPVPVPAATAKPGAATPAATQLPAASAVPVTVTAPTPVPTPAGATVIVTPAGTRLVPMPPPLPPLRPLNPLAPSPPTLVLASPPPAQPPPPPPLAMVPLPAALAPLLAPPTKAAAPSPARSPQAPYVVRDVAATALAAELLVQGPAVWPFDSGKQALLVGALAAVLPGLGPGAISVTGTGAPFRRRLLQVSMGESVLVETQMNAGSADRVPVVRAQLQNATTSGQLQSTLNAMGLRVTRVQMQAATAAVPPLEDTTGGLTTSAIVGLCVAAFLAVLLAAGAYYVCVHRQCLSWSNKVAAAADAEQPKGAATPKEGTRVKPFYEAPQFAQTYTRAPSLVQERPPLHPHAKQLPHPNKPSRLVR